MRRAKGAVLCLAVSGVIAGCGDTVTKDLQGMLAATAVEAAGENCPNGGTRLSVGVDDDGDGVLTDSEVDSTTYLCAPDNAQTGTLVVSSVEPAGENCPNGGSLIETGIDADADGDLSAEEIAEAAYICAPDGPGDPLARAEVVAAGDDCLRGGIRIDVGFDTDADGALSGDETVSISFACYDDFVGATPISESIGLGMADESCPGGYVETWYGADTNASGTLDPDERRASVVRCNALPSITGEAYVRVEDCGEGFAFAPAVSDVDDDALSVTAEVLIGPDDTTVSVHEDGTVSGTSPLYEGGVAIEVTVTDPWGASASRVFVAAFTGDGCTPTVGFFGVVPGTCVTRDISSVVDWILDRTLLLGDDLLLSGEPGLFHADIAFETIERITGNRYDLLFSDVASESLYSLWYSGSEAESLAELGGVWVGNDVWDQVVPVDAETSEIGTRVDLEYPIWVQRSQSVSIDEVSYSFYAYTLMMAAHDGVLVVGMMGDLDEAPAVLFQTFDVETGDRLSEHWIRSESEEDRGAVFVYEWSTFESPVTTGLHFVRDEIPYVAYRTYRANWIEVNLDTFEISPASESFATDCAPTAIAFDPVDRLVYGTAAGGCFSNGEAANEIFRCDALPFPNDGSVDDTGEGQPFFFD